MKLTFPVFGLLLVTVTLATAQTPAPKPDPAKPHPPPDKPATTSAPAPDANKPPAPAAPAAHPTPKKRSIADVTKNGQIFNGLFRVYADRESGSMFLYVRKDQLQREFLYFSHVSDGVASAGRNRGQFDEQEVFAIFKRFERLDFIVQ